MATMTAKERLTRAARGQEVDRVPALGGWVNGAANLARMAGITNEQYLADPLAGVIKANLVLGVDGLIGPSTPKTLEEIRGGHTLEESFPNVQPEAIVEYAGTLPDTEKDVLADFDAARHEQGFRDHFAAAFAKWGGITPIPNYWDLGGHFPLYHQFGYVAFLSACALYPETVDKIWWVRSLASRERAKILARLYRELDLVPLLFCGEDLCNNQGPMVSPKFLREHYFPHVKMILAPIVDAGVRVVHHCDGDVRPVIGDFLGCGFSGFQGFQYEVGVDPYELRKLRSLRGEEPILFAGLSVTRTLPFGSPDDVREEVDWLIDATDGGRGMFLFTSNVVGVEVNPENVLAAYRHVREYDPSRPRKSERRPWPWASKHRD